jgi:hypothetical protein
VWAPEFCNKLGFRDKSPADTISPEPLTCQGNPVRHSGYLFSKTPRQFQFCGLASGLRSLRQQQAGDVLVTVGTVMDLIVSA